jgi:hypothetical protein
MHSTILPVTPGAIIGYRKDGRPIRLIGGASEPVPPAPANGAPDPAQPPAPSAPPAAPAAPPAPAPAANAEPGGQPQQGGQQPGSVDDLPGWAQKTIRELRSESAASRTKAKEQADALAAFQATHQTQLDGIARALGLKPEDATPEQLMAARDAANADRDAERARARAAQVELAAYRAAAISGADPVKLLDSRAFVATLDGLDPSSDGFAQTVADRVATAIESNPSWRLAPAPVPGQPPAPPAPGAPAPPLPPPAVPASGPQGSFTPPPPGPRQLTEADAKEMTPAQVVEAINKGLFADAGFGPSRRSQR